MKKILYFLLIFSFSIQGFCQYDETSPWITKEQSKRELTFDEIVTSFNNYWKNRDFSKKGSGHKPFKRWEYHWQNLVKPNGYLITSEEIWNAWQQKKQNQTGKLLSLPSANWTPVGPFTHTNTGSWSSGQGRVNIVHVDPSNPNTIYIGAPAGGIWKSTNSGSTWTALTDELPQIGVSGIAVDYSNSNTIYIATGDKDAGDTSFAGIFKSTDGGTTWTTTGTLSGVTRAGDLLIHPTNNQILWCATNTGIFKSINGGTSWTNVQSGNFSKGNIRLKPDDPTVIYATTLSGFYKSTNSGDTFTAITTGLPTSSGRLVLDVTPADANYVYILSSTTGAGFQGIYRSVDSGSNWAQISNTSTPAIFDGSTQASYDLALAVSSTNKDEIYTGVLNIWKSTNGGLGFTKVNNWNAPSSAAYTHADIHFLRYFGSKLYAGTDGGIYISSNNGTNFTDLTAGLQISQFYKVAVSKQTASKMVGGLQDNGGYAYSSSLWKNYYGADGMDAAIDATNSNKYFGFIQYGGTLYISNNAGNSSGGSVAAPTAETGTNDDGGNWVTPLATNNSGGLFAGYSRLYKLNGAAWAQQSTGTIGSGDIELITVAPSNDNIMFVVNGTGLYKSTDGGVNFANVYTAPANITSVCVHYSDPNIVYITTTGTGGQALKSTNGGSTFTSFSQNLPSLAKNVIRHQGRHSLNPLYLGTSLGVYYRDDSMTQWEPFDTNLPNVSVRDLEINLEDNILVAATYGRGIWQTAIPFETQSNDIKLVEVTSPNNEVNCTPSISPVVNVKNNGTNPINSIDFTYDYNASPQNYTWTGTIASGASQNITLPTLNVTSKGAYNLNVSSNITGEIVLDNNSGSTGFYINDGGTVGVTNTFTNSTDALLTYNGGSLTSQWQRGENTNGALATTGNNVYTTNFTGSYPNAVKAYLVSQCYNLSSVVNPMIKFKMAFDLELNWDIVYVEYSTDMGQNWTLLGTQSPNWYNSNRTPGSDCSNCPGNQWTGTNTTLTEYSYPLTSLAGQSNVIFRIVFHSDDAVTQLGVVVDDFIIDGTLANENFELANVAVYPNPSSGEFSISIGDKSIDKLEVYDLSGKTILTLDSVTNSNNVYLLNLGNAAKGIYFLKINSGEEQIVKRIIKN